MSALNTVLEWEESVFRGLKAVYDRVVLAPRERRVRAVQTQLKPLRYRELLLAAMISGRQVALFETDNAVLTYRGRICLPSAFSAADSVEANLALYDLKTILGALALRDGWRADSGTLTQLVEKCAAEFPNLPGRIAAVQATLPADQDLLALFGLPASDAAELDGAPIALDPAHDPAQTEAVTEIEGKGQVDVQVEPDKSDDGPGADMPLHTFEKVETLEEYNGLSRKSDDEDELDTHAEALREVDMKRVLRSRERPRSVYRSDIVLDNAGWELERAGRAHGIPYPEWDYARGHYRANWCFVQEDRTPDAPPEWQQAAARRNAGLVMLLKRQFATLANAQLRLKRQTSGPDVDIDAVVERAIRLAAGQTPNEAIYIDPRRRLHDVSALIVLDESFSTDSYLHGARVLDTIADIMFCVGETLDEFGIDFGVAGFSSNTRRNCAFSLVKDFDEDWRGARGRLGALRTNGYTRIGPALRHGQHLLDARPAERKVIILITDGRPCDYDRYEGAYGVHDVKKAIEEGRNKHIMTYAFAIDKQAREHFHLMFTPHHYNVISNPASLSLSMTSLFGRLKLSS